MEQEVKEIKHGGARPGAGRKRRMEEQEIIEKFSPYEPLFFEALEARLKAHDSRAMELYSKYYLGEPLKRVETKIEGNISGLAVEIINKLDEANDTSK